MREVQDTFELASPNSDFSVARAEAHAVFNSMNPSLLKDAGIRVAQTLILVRPLLLAESAGVQQAFDDYNQGVRI